MPSGKTALSILLTNLRCFLLDLCHPGEAERAGGFEHAGRGSGPAATWSMIRSFVTKSFKLTGSHCCFWQLSCYFPDPATENWTNKYYRGEQSAPERTAGQNGDGEMSSSWIHFFKTVLSNKTGWTQMLFLVRQCVLWFLCNCGAFGQQFYICPISVTVWV